MWRVGEQRIRISVDSLLETLLERQLKDRMEPAELLSKQFLEFLGRRKSFHEASMLQLIYMSFMLGYYYRVFLNNNKVEYEPIIEGPTGSDNDLSSSSGPANTSTH